MGESIYRELIKDMTWSYSRLEAFDSCPYRWYLQYIHYPKLMKEDKFYAVYGLFMHELLESYYTAKMAKDEVMLAFLTQFPERTQGAGRPNPGTVRKYFQSGKEYIRNLKPLRFDMVSVEEKIDFHIGGMLFTGRIDYLGTEDGEYVIVDNKSRDLKPLRFDMVSVEEKIDFHIGGMLFTGRIDYLGTEDGEYVIVDNKSRDLKPRSGRAKPTLKDKELDIMLRQLYIYAEAVRQKYGKLPKLLCFNCFKTGMLIEEPFREDAYHEALLWAEGKIREILDVDEFPPNIEFFGCRYICSYSSHCCYWKGGGAYDQCG